MKISCRFHCRPLSPPALDDDSDGVLAPRRGPSPKRRRPDPSGRRPKREGGHGGGGGGPAPPTPPVPLPLPGPAPGPGPPAIEDDGDGVMGGAQEPAAPSRRRRPPRRDDAADFFAGFQDTLVKYEDNYTPPGKTERYVNWTMKCKYHDDCYRTRGVTPFNTRHFGELEALAFLHAWTETPFDAGTSKYKSHRLQPPTPASVETFFHEHEEALRNVLTLARG